MTLFLILLLALLLLFPTACLEGARSGLLLWFHTVLPTLFPFLFVSSMLLATGAAHTVSRLLKPILAPIFRVSTDCCYAILIGLVSGYPLGAKTCAELVQDGSISRQEGQYLLCFCNNASPMFLISFIGSSLLGLPHRSCLLFWLVVIVSAFFTGILYRLFSKYSAPQNHYSLYAAGKSVDSIADSPLEYALETAIQTIVKVGGYIILFGILGHLITRLSLPFPLLQGMLAGVLEITTGSSAIAALSLPSALKTALICAVTAFGGLSSVLQTKSVLGSSGLSVATYLYTKVLHALLAAALSGILLLFNVF
ncbi:MAG: hypothetical protein HFI40_08110 [Lachnospiraceae bacterium]|jgi:sporulation integral membrane protein YlbJ|nr:hypothetical protein [Lachnospiraceae bacterium]